MEGRNGLVEGHLHGLLGVLARLRHGRDVIKSKIWRHVGHGMAVVRVIGVSKVDNLGEGVHLTIGVLGVVYVGHDILHAVGLRGREGHAVGGAHKWRLERRRWWYDSEHADVNLIGNHGFSVVNLRPGARNCNRAAAVIANAAVVLCDLDLGAGFELQIADCHALFANDESHFFVGDGQCLGDDGLALEGGARLQGRVVQGPTRAGIVDDFGDELVGGSNGVLGARNEDGAIV